ncbi:tail protein X [Vibrio mediterranei]|uniref:tail protein X n=1 Tax=Vibrio mediterranei TaxID=689 RepID=UPI0022834287|nr:tail protein X [Vibrio mediterranei]MCY9855821.1 tail protein X [Vibrio mediterranei]
MRAKQGERWDTLCLRAYGRCDEPLVMKLREANRTLIEAGADFVFLGGEQVRLIEIPEQAAEVGAPPWLS